MTQFDHSPKSTAFPTLWVINLGQLLKRVGLLAFLSCGMSSAVQVASAEMLQHRWAGDVPIMNGFSIEPELGFAFDSPNGRIVMIFASSSLPEPQIMSFYDSTLAQLGWGGGDGNWIRGEEKLVIGAVQTERGPLWRIMLKPN